MRLCSPAPASYDPLSVFTPSAVKEKLRYTVMLCARGDGDSMRGRIASTAHGLRAVKLRPVEKHNGGMNPIAYEYLQANYVASGYPAGGISFGIRPSSRFDTQEGELWMWEDVGRRPDSSPLNRPPRVSLCWTTSGSTKMRPSRRG